MNVSERLIVVACQSGAERYGDVCCLLSVIWKGTLGIPIRIGILSFNCWLSEANLWVLSG
jgi:hypothetical protein